MGIVVVGIGVAIVVKAGLTGLGYKVYKDSKNNVKIRPSKLRERKSIKRKEVLLLKSKMTKIPRKPANRPQRNY